MKRNSFLQAIALCMVIAFASCSKKQSEYTNSIPADAPFVLSIDAQSLATKAELNSAENQPMMQRFTEMLTKDITPENRQKVEAFFSDPASTGIDFRSPLYLFYQPDTLDYIAIVAKVNNETDLASTFQTLQTEQAATTLATAEGYRYCTIGGNLFTAFNATTLIALSYVDQTGDAQQLAASLLRQEADKSFAQTPSFQHMQQETGDIRFMLTQKLIADLQTKTNALTSGNALPPILTTDGLQGIGNIAFETGKIECSYKWTADNDKAQATLDEAIGYTRPVSNRFLGCFPQSTLFYTNVGINGSKLYDYIQQMPDLQRFGKVQEADFQAIMNTLKPAFESLEGDITMGFTGVVMGAIPTFIAYAEVKDNTILDLINANKQKLEQQNGVRIDKINDTEYALSIYDLGIYYGIRDNFFYTTNDNALYANLGKPATPSITENEYADLLKNSYAAMLIDIESVLQLPAVRNLANMSGAETALAISLCDQYVDYMATTASDAQSSYGVLQLKDHESNALKQLVSLAKNAIGM